MSRRTEKPEGNSQPEEQPKRMERSLQPGSGAADLPAELMAELQAASGAEAAVEPALAPEAPEATETEVAEFVAAAAEAEDAGMTAGKSDMPDAATRELGGSGEDRGMGSGLLDDPFEAPDVPASAPPVPPEQARIGSPIFSPAAFETPDVLQGVAGATAPTQGQEKQFKKELVDKFVTSKRLESLWQRVDEAKIAIDKRVHSLTVARNLLDLLKAARNELMAGEENFEEAERYINEVEFRVIQNERMRRWSNTYGYILFLYELLWGIILAWWALVRYGDRMMSPTNSLDVLIISMVVGGIGGVMGGVFSLVKHIALEQDFDRQHSIWYVTSPLMGLGVGAVIYLFMGVGLLSISSGQTPSSPLVIYILAWLAGYQHNVFIDIVKRILKVIFVAEDKDKNKDG